MLDFHVPYLNRKLSNHLETLWKTKTLTHPGYFDGNFIVRNIINLYYRDEGRSDYNSRTVRKVIQPTSLNVIFLIISSTLYIIPLLILILIIFNSFNDAFHLPILLL